jgi:hypothetical protein
MPASLPRLGGWRSVGVLVAAAAVVTGIGQTGAGHSALENAGLIQRPTGYTALTFLSPLQPLQPPKKAKDGRRVRYRLTFAIQNAEPGPRDYRWSVLLAQPGSQPRVIATSNTQRVVPGNKATIPFSATVSCRPGSVEFIVQLADPSEAIHAWGSCPRHRG